jgi:diguanylate cyclase (GGDEF)-like protein
MNTQDELVELGLRDPQAHLDGSPGGSASDFADRIMALLAELTPDAPAEDVVRFRRQLTTFRQILGEPARRAEVPRALAFCIASCEKFFLASQQYRADRESEYTDIIAILREAARISFGDSDGFHHQMVESSERIGRLGNLDDVRELKHRLADEVHALRQTVDQKHQREELAFEQLNQRVEALQIRLSQVEEEAALDELTRVANRRGFDRTLTRMVEQARTRQVPLSLAMVDIDDFKTINDTHGHPVGDRVLLCTAQQLTRGLRQSDFVARYGGEEFAILLASPSSGAMEERLRGIVAGIAADSYEYELLGRRERVNFTVSCGLTELQPGDTAASLVTRADDALYEAKRKGKNRVVAKRRSGLKSLLSWG